MEKVVFKLDPWFSNLAAHQNHQELLEKCTKPQSKPIKSELRSVVVRMFKGSPGYSNEKLG